VAAARLTTARVGVKAVADEHNVPVENLLTPDYVRRLMWEPPSDDDSNGSLEDSVTARLTELGARRWQVELTREVLVEAIRSPGRTTTADPDEA
jgi:ribonuclease D